MDNSIITRSDDGKKGRFVVYDAEESAGEMTYTWAGESKFIIDHTEINEKFGRKGYGKALVMAAIEFARKENLKILPLCPFARSVFDRTTGVEDVRF